MIKTQRELIQSLKPIQSQRKFARYYAFHPLRVGLMLVALLLQYLGLIEGELITANEWYSLAWTFVRGVVYILFIFIIQAHYLRFCAIWRIPFVWSLFLQYAFFLLLYELIVHDYVAKYNDTPVHILMMQEMGYSLLFIIAFAGFFGRQASLALFDYPQLYPTWTRFQYSRKEAEPMPVNIRFMKSKTPNTEISTDSATIVVFNNLTSCIDKLPEDLGWRIHRSYWVGKSELTEVKYFGGNPYVILTKGETIPCSRKIVPVIKAHLASKKIEDVQRDVE